MKRATTGRPGCEPAGRGELLNDKLLIPVEAEDSGQASDVAEVGLEHAEDGEDARPKDLVNSH